MSKEKNDIDDWDDFEEVDLTKKRYFSDDHRKKIGENLKKRMNDPEFLEEHKQKTSKTTKERWKKGIYDSQRKHKSEYISEFRKKFGNKYDYSLLDDYPTKRKPLRIICPEHGEFTIASAKTHRTGQECPVCKPHRKYYTQETILEEFRKIHGDRYDYSKVVFKTVGTKITVICSIHGEFETTPSTHKSGAGCTRCVNSIPQEKVEQIRNLIEQGFSKKEVSEQLGIAKNTVARYDKSLGLNKFSFPNIEKRNQVVKELHEKGYSPKDIGNKVGVSRSRIYKTLKILGLR